VVDVAAAHCCCAMEEEVVVVAVVWADRVALSKRFLSWLIERAANEIYFITDQIIATTKPTRAAPTASFSTPSAMLWITFSTTER
jgi:hypothetical protein